MKQNERDELLTRLDERTQETNNDIKEIKDTLFGNGREGLCYIVARHKIYFGLIGTAILILAGIIINSIF